MSRLRRAVHVCVLVGALTMAMAAMGASAASASTFFVNERGGSATCSGPGINACPTIKEAVAQAEKTTGPNTIEVEPQPGGTTYSESINLLNSKDAGLTINGEEPGVVILGQGGPAVLAHLAGAVTLSNLAIRVGTTGVIKSAIADRLTALTLDNVAVENGSGEGIDGIEARELGSVTMNGGSVEMEGGAKGWAVYAYESPLVLNGVKIVNGAAAPDEAGGIYSEKSSLSLTNTQVSVESGETAIGIAAGKDSSVSMQNVAVRQNGPAMGVALENSPATVNGLRVEMVHGPSSKVPALLSELEAPGASSTFSHVEIGGAWTGSGFLAAGDDVTLSDSHVSTGASSGSAALAYVGSGSSRGLLVQRSVLQAAPSAKGTLVAEIGNATIDSSEILGGKSGVSFENTTASTDTLTLSASTLDAGAPGITADAAGTNGVEAIAKGGPGSVANIAIQGSIVLEKQVASAAAGDQANVACTYSAVPSQAQAAGGGAGVIACASGSAGNTEVNPLTSLFSAPITSYGLLAGSSAIDSVPASAVTLPFGITPSATDLAGNPRVVDGNGDCVAVQDKGALELQGFSKACPPPPPPPPPLQKPTITALSVTPNAFYAALSGATISKAKKPKKKYGATISWRDSLAATTTFTVLRETSGRKQGKSCRKPSKANKHGKRCTILTAIGSFTHTDAAGANKLHFSGRLKGRKLAKGSYKLQAVPHNAAGNGKAVSRAFKIKG